VCWFLLRRRGIDGQLQFGARQLDGRIEAHAWVEVDGRPINDTPDVRQRFQPLEPCGASALSPQETGDR
jgi:hypothetical protein